MVHSVTEYTNVCMVFLRNTVGPHGARVNVLLTPIWKLRPYVNLHGALERSTALFANHLTQNITQISLQYEKYR